ncbi:MAG: triose-phosphate isomerase [Desulfobacterales bacterium]|nr:triose-phosphate isomerase [Desulfobacterales bacterium]
MKNRRPLIAGNWKMYKTIPEAVQTAKTLLDIVKYEKDTDIMIAPTFTALSSVNTIIQDSNIGLGAQNIFWETEGAYTGEISPDMLLSAGCKYVIIGHSERRQYFNETDETVNKKIKAALQAELIPVFCIGETENERKLKKTFSVLDNQIKKGLKDFSTNDVNNLVIAYEPVWAIGTGLTATKEQAQEAHNYIRNLLNELFGKDIANGLRILYGGSVKPNNIKSLMEMEDIDGALVGGASLDAESFAKIIKFNKN